ncbi:MAG: hypothetical protein GY774_16390 [Planctomycetes bacterium]|nr:hypothetical protein [Planctomycetota bacterium]
MKEEIVMDTNLPEGTELGALCRNKHAWNNLGKSVRRDLGRGRCIECLRIQNDLYRKKKRLKKAQKNITEMVERKTIVEKDSVKDCDNCQFEKLTCVLCTFIPKSDALLDSELPEDVFQ